MPTCAIVSFRLGLTDGVSIVAATWAGALRSFGFDVVTVAGEGTADRRIPGLAIGAGSSAPEGVGTLERAVADALRDVELVVVENLCTIPLNLPAARAVARALAGRPAMMHHHDPAWQRERFSGVTELPVDDPAWRHVTINRMTQREFSARGIEATTIYNGFDTRPIAGDRDATRARLGVGTDELVVGHPVRAIARKGIPAALALSEALGATYWLLGEAEEGYGPELDRLLTGARCRVVRRPLPHGPDVYAAPDLIAFPSTWEGFGNPPIEASLALKPVAVGPYPVGEELRALGFEWFDADQVGPIREWLDAPDPAILHHNRRVAEEHFSLEVMIARLRSLLDEAGWLP